MEGSRRQEAHAPWGCGCCCCCFCCPAPTYPAGPRGSTPRSRLRAAPAAGLTRVGLSKNVGWAAVVAVCDPRFSRGAFEAAGEVAAAHRANGWPGPARRAGCAGCFGPCRRGRGQSEDRRSAQRVPRTGTTPQPAAGTEATRAALCGASGAAAARSRPRHTGARFWATGARGGRGRGPVAEGKPEERKRRPTKCELPRERSEPRRTCGGHAA